MVKISDLYVPLTLCLLNCNKHKNQCNAKLWAFKTSEQRFRKWMLLWLLDFANTVSSKQNWSLTKKNLHAFREHLIWYKCSFIQLQCTSLRAVYWQNLSIWIKHINRWLDNPISFDIKFNLIQTWEHFARLSILFKAVCLNFFILSLSQILVIIQNRGFQWSLKMKWLRYMQHGGIQMPIHF